MHPESCDHSGQLGIYATKHEFGVSDGNLLIYVFDSVLRKLMLSWMYLPQEEISIN